MDKKLAGMLGAATALAAFGTAQARAAVTPQTADAAMEAGSYADLLKPIPNASALLAASDAAAGQGQAPAIEGATVQDVQYHHHWHRRWRRHRYYHHHHHHHHSVAFIVSPAKPVA